MRNPGDLPLENVKVAFYIGNPEGPGEEEPDPIEDPEMPETPDFDDIEDPEAPPLPDPEGDPAPETRRAEKRTEQAETAGAASRRKAREDDAILIGTATVEGILRAGTTGSASLTWTPDEYSAVAIFAVADPDGEIAETVEDDNMGYGYPLKADLELIHCEPKRLPDGTVDMVTLVRNNSRFYAMDYGLTFYADDMATEETDDAEPDSRRGAEDVNPLQQIVSFAGPPVMPGMTAEIVYPLDPGSEFFSKNPRIVVTLGPDDRVRKTDDGVLPWAAFSLETEEFNGIAVSGRITDSEGAGIEGIQVTGTNEGGETVTDSLGNYALNVEPGWSGTVTPSESGFAFTPASSDHTDVREDQFSQDFLIASENHAPLADAGADQSVFQGKTVTLDGSGSSDPDPEDTLSYEWTQIGGTAVILSDPKAVRPGLTAVLSSDPLVFRLTVTDAQGLSDEDEVSVTTRALREHHSADCNPRDNVITLSELLRVIQLYNVGEHRCAPGSEDGYAAGHGDPSCEPHTSDYNPTDWKISLSELLRVIQIYASSGYESDPEGEDGFGIAP